MRAGFLATTTAAMALLAATAAHAQDATWLTVPPSALGNFNTATNWTPNVVPGSITSTGTAFFGPSAVTSLTIAARTTLSGFTFNAGALAYFFSLPGVNSTLVFNGAGIINNFSNPPSFSLASGAFLNFTNSSTAGNAIITTAVASNLNFGGTSSAGTATITNNGGVIFFNNSGSAGAATISNSSGGLLDLFGNSTAANATIINSASVAFFNNASGGQARFINNAGGTLDISGAAAPVTFGSIEGAGTYQLGSNELITGLNNVSTTVASAASSRLLITFNLFVFQDNCRAGAQLKFITAVTFRSRLEPGSVRRAVQFISKKRRLTASKMIPPRVRSWAESSWRQSITLAGVNRLDVACGSNATDGFRACVGRCPLLLQERSFKA